jgi:hypothetical protein
MKPNTHTIKVCSDLKEIFYRQFLSTSRSKFYKHYSNNSLFTTNKHYSNNSPFTTNKYRVLFYITQNPNRSSIFYIIVRHFKTQNYVALVSFPGSMEARPPCCYCRLKKLRHYRVIPCKILSSVFILICNPTRASCNYIECIYCLIKRNSNLEFCLFRVSNWGKV